MRYTQTTYIPNEIFDIHLKSLTKAELKILLIILRQTNGWIDKRTGKRKQRDRISHSQFMDKTGLCRRVVSEAVQSLLNKKLIQVTNVEGVPMEASARRGQCCLYYQYQGVEGKMIQVLKKVSVRHGIM